MPPFPKPTRNGCYFFLAAIIATLLLMGDPAVRAANAVCDDHPLLFSEYSKDPGRFSGDILNTYAHALRFSSVQNWLPAFLYTTAGVPPLWLAVLFVFFQNVVLLFALRDLVQSFGIRGPAVWLAPWFVYAAQPWRWNLAWYHSVMHSPYPGHLVVPLLVYSLSRLVREDFKLSALFLFLAAFVHPSQTVYAGFISALFLVLRFGVSDPRALARRGVWYLPALGACFFPTLFILSGEENLLSRTELMETLFHNGHFVPWTKDTFFDWALPTFLGAVVLTGLALKRTAGLTRNVPVYFVTLSITMVLFTVGQLVGMHWGIPPLAQLIPMRVSVLVALTLFPIAVSFLIQEFLAAKVEKRISAAFILLYHSIFPLGFCLGPAVVVGDKVPRRIPPRVWLAAWFVLILFVFWRHMDVTAAFLLPGRGGVTLSRFLGIILMSVPLGFLATKRDRVAPEKVLALALGLLLAYTASREGKTTLAGPSRDMYDAQLWARTGTPESAIFISPDQGPWRTFSLRRTVHTMPFNFHVYTRSRKSKDHGDAVAAFYQKEGVKAFAELKPDGILRFREAFGGDYLIGGVETPQPFPEVYRNPTYVVYRLPH